MLALIIYALLALNLITFITYGIDKRKARKSHWRIPESTLLLLALLGGSIGAWLGMKAWRHKTQHAKFYIGIPLIISGQIILLIYLIKAYT